MVAAKVDRYVQLLLLAIFVLGPVMWYADWTAWQENPAKRPQPTILSLRTLIRELPFGDSYQVTKAFDKAPSVRVHAYAQVDQPVAEVMEVFRRRATDDGWKVKSDISSSRGIQYCRRGISLGARPEVIEGGTRLSVDVAWTYARKAEDYCP